MRTLHTVGQHERLVARGQYRMLWEGQETGKVEDWNLHHLPDGSSVLRADVDGRNVTAPEVRVESVLVHMLHDPDGQADRLHVRYEAGGRKAEVQVTLFSGYAMVNRSVDRQKMGPKEIELPEDIVVHAPCAASNPIHVYDEEEGSEWTARTLHLALDGAEDRLLAPDIRELTLAFEGTHALELDGLGHFEAQHVVLDGQTDVHMDACDVVLRRAEREVPWVTQLARYARFDGERG